MDVPRGRGALRVRVCGALAVVFVTVAAALGAPARAQAAYRGFPDVDPGAWYVSELDYALDHGLVSGLADGRFGPGEQVSRAQAVTVLWNMAGSPAVDAPDYPDVDYGAFYGGAVKWARATGEVAGHADGTFAPNETVTREQLAVMLMNYLNKVAKQSYTTPGWNAVGG